MDTCATGHSLPSDNASARDAGVPESCTEPPAAAPVILGHNEEEEVQLDLEVLSNPHLLCTGESGKGKTAAIKCLAAQYAQQGKDVLIVDCQDDFVGDFASLTGARVYDLGQTGLPFDPMELPVDGLTGRPVNLAYWMEEWASYFAGAYPQLGPVQLSILKQAMRNLHLARGQFCDLPREIERLSREGCPAAPISSLLHHISTPFVVGMFRRGTFRYSSMFSGNHIAIVRVPTSSPAIKMLVGSLLLKSYFRHVSMSANLDALWRDGKSSPITSIAVLDELHLWNRQSLMTIEMLYRTGRKFGLAVWGISQCTTDLAEPILANADTKLFFGTSAKGAKAALEQLALTPAEKTALYGTLLSLRSGRAVLRNSQHLPYCVLDVNLFHDWKHLLPEAERTTNAGVPPTPDQTCADHQVLTPDTPLLCPPDVADTSAEMVKEASSPVKPTIDLSRIRYLARACSSETVAEVLERLGIDGRAAELMLLPLLVAEVKTWFPWPRAHGVVFDPHRERIVRNLRTIQLQEHHPPELTNLSAPALQVLRDVLMPRPRHRAAGTALRGDDSQAYSEVENSGMVTVGIREPQMLIHLARPVPIAIPRGQPYAPISAPWLVHPASLGEAAFKLLQLLRVLWGFVTMDIWALAVPVYCTPDGAVVPAAAPHMIQEMTPAAMPA